MKKTIAERIAEKQAKREKSLARIAIEDKRRGTPKLEHSAIRVPALHDIYGYQSRLYAKLHRLASDASVPNRESRLYIGIQAAGLASSKVDSYVRFCNECEYLFAPILSEAANGKENAILAYLRLTQTEFVSSVYGMKHFFTPDMLFRH